MRALNMFMVLGVIITSSCFLTFGREIKNVKSTTCEIQLGECEQNLDPIYHQPAELARSWQTCRIAVLEEKVRVMQYEQKVNELQDKINNLEAKISAIHSKEPIMQTTPVSELSPGVEGHWVVIHNAVIPNDAMTTLADGNIRSHLDYVGRTRLMEHPVVVVPCRSYNKIDCHYTVGYTHGSRSNFEVLLNKRYKWKWTNSTLPIPNNAIIGGYRQVTSSNRELIYIGRAVHDRFVNHGYTENELVMGEVDGHTKTLVHTAWSVLQTKTIYQILVSS